MCCIVQQTAHTRLAGVVQWDLALTSVGDKLGRVRSSDSDWRSGYPKVTRGVGADITTVKAGGVRKSLAGAYDVDLLGPHVE